MAASIRSGPSWVSFSQDKEGQRTYKLMWIVEHGVDEGPVAVYNCSDLPQPGSFYAFGSEADPWAFCYWANEVVPLTPDETCSLSKITFTFSTKPEDKMCRTQEVEDPLMEPPKISGSFAKYQEEATRDRFGTPITNSSWEQVRGPHNEWDRNRLSVKIQQNVGTALQGYVLPQRFMDCVNAFPLWGLPPRTIKLSSAPWEAKFWGSCSVYYTRTLEFDIRYALQDDGSYETWDRDMLDEGTKVLRGQWNNTTGAWDLVNIAGAAPNPNDPTHFIKVPDRQGEKLGKIPLNGRGLPANCITMLQGLFVSVVAGNVGNPLTDTTKWFPISGDPTKVPPNWDATVTYTRGQLVVAGGAIYIALFTQKNDLPQNLTGLWSGPLSNPLVNQGTRSNIQIYPAGDYVSDKGTTTSVGKIHVERYPGVDFTLMGIPISF